MHEQRTFSDTIGIAIHRHDGANSVHRGDEHEARGRGGSSFMAGICGGGDRHRRYHVLHHYYCSEYVILAASYFSKALPTSFSGG